MELVGTGNSKATAIKPICIQLIFKFVYYHVEPANLVKMSRQLHLNAVMVIGVAEIFDWGGPNRKSHAMTSSETSKEEFFVGAKISWNERSEAVAWCWHVTWNSFKGEGLNQ